MAKTARGLTARELEQETIKLARDLAFCARGPVNIQLINGPELAYTTNTGEENCTIEIRMNPKLIAGIRNKERAIQIWRGGGFHELAHHIWAKPQQYKRASEEGFHNLFNLLDDEQNERRGRALDPDWGACFQTMCAHIFSSKARDNHEELLVGHAHEGDEDHKRTGEAASEIYTRRWNIFAWHLRRGVPDPADPVAASALALIPRRFKDLSADELLALTRKIHKTLLQGIELPPAKPALVKRDSDKAQKEQSNNTNNTSEEAEPEGAENEADSSREHPAPAPSGGQSGGESSSPEDADESDEPAPLEESDENSDEEEEDNDETEDSDKSAPKSWQARKLLTSRWTYGLFGLMVTGWVCLFAQIESSHWLSGLGFVALAAVVITVGLFIRRAAIKSMLKRHTSANANTPGTSKSAKVLWQESSNRKKGALAGLALAVTGVGCGSLILSLGFSWVTILVLGIASLVVLIVIGIVCRRPAIALATKSIKAAAPTARTLGRALVRLPLAWVGTKLVWLAKTIWLGISTVGRAIGAGIKWGYKRIAYAVSRAYHNARVHLFPRLRKLYDHTAFRLAILAIPVSVFAMMVYAIVVAAGSMNIWLLSALIVLLLLLLGAAIVFRKNLMNFILNELLMPMPALMIHSILPQLDMDTEWFNEIDNVVQTEADQELLDHLLPEIQPLAQMLRPYMERCGQSLVDKENEPDGYDLCDELELSLLGETAIFTDEDMQSKASVHLEIAVDCSSSMQTATASLAPGEKFELAKKFALMIEQASSGLPHVSGRLWGFTDSQIYDCGTLGERRVSGLVCGGGNNDAAMLQKMGESAANSGKKVKILLMLSDGQPSNCSWLALKNLVDSYEQQGMIPWNFGLDVIQTPAFERFFTDLVGQTQLEAIVTMGETLASIADGLR